MKRYAIYAISYFALSLNCALGLTQDASIYFDDIDNKLNVKMDGKLNPVDRSIQNPLTAVDQAAVNSLDINRESLINLIKNRINTHKINFMNDNLEQKLGDK